MTNDYRIEPAGTAFRVLDPWGEYLVDLFSTREAVQQDIDRCKREDECTKPQSDSWTSRMRKVDVDRETAEYWIHRAMGG